MAARDRRFEDQDPDDFGKARGRNEAFQPIHFDEYRALTPSTALAWAVAGGVMIWTGGIWFLLHAYRQ